jgi:hypothetical protein
LYPRNPRDVEQRFESDEVFVVAQRRRAQSEERIGILENAFLDGVSRAKGFKNRSLQVSCAVLALFMRLGGRQMPENHEKWGPFEKDGVGTGRATEGSHA